LTFPQSGHEVLIIAIKGKKENYCIAISLLAGRHLILFA